MSFQLPPIDKDSRSLRTELETVVRDMSRFHKYEVGQVIRTQMRIVRNMVTQVWWEKDNKAHAVSVLVRAIDALKNDLQLAQDVRAFKSFPQFQMIYRKAEALGRQAGGMQRNLPHPKGQNAGDRRVCPQCAQILSTGAASQGANA